MRIIPGFDEGGMGGCSKITRVRFRAAGTRRRAQRATTAAISATDHRELLRGTVESSLSKRICCRLDGSRDDLDRRSVNGAPAFFILISKYFFN